MVPCVLFGCPHFLPLLSPWHSLNHQNNLVELSFLPRDTGKHDVFSAALELPLLKQKERRTEVEEQDQKGEKKEKNNQKRNEKKNQREQEEVKVPSKEKKEPQRPQVKSQDKRERQESESEQVSPSGRIEPHLTEQRHV